MRHLTLRHLGGIAAVVLLLMPLAKAGPSGDTVGKNIKTEQLPEVEGPSAGFVTPAEGGYPPSIWGKSDPSAPMARLAAADLAALPPPLRLVTKALTLSEFPKSRDPLGLLRARLEILWRLGAFSDYRKLLASGGPEAFQAEGWRAIEAALAAGEHQAACQQAPLWVEREASSRAERLAEFCAALGGDAGQVAFIRQILDETGGADPVLEELIGRILAEDVPPPSNSPDAAPNNAASPPALIRVSDALTFAAARAAHVPVDPDSLDALEPGLRAAVLPPPPPAPKKGDIRAALIFGHMAKAIGLAASMKAASLAGDAGAAKTYAKLRPWFVIRQTEGMRALQPDAYRAWAEAGSQSGTAFVTQSALLSRLFQTLGIADPSGTPSPPAQASPAASGPAPESGGAALAAALPAFLPGVSKDKRIAGIAALHAAGMDWDAATLGLILMKEAGL